MGLLDDIRADIITITTDDVTGFADTLTLTAPTGEVAVIKGLHTKHHFAIDPDSGKQVNVKNAHSSFGEKQLRDLGYPTRNSDNEVSLKGHKLKASNPSGEWNYLIREWFPDETLGYIVCILGDFVDGNGKIFGIEFDKSFE